MRQKKIFLTIGQLFLVGIFSFQGLSSLNGFDNILKRDYSPKTTSEVKISNYQNTEDVKDVYSFKNLEEKDLKTTVIEKSDFFYAVASWYGPGFHGRKMANGQVFDMYNESFIAHKKLPFGTKLEINNPKNDSVLYAVVTDRGPYIPGRDFDLSYAGAEKLGIVDKGVAQLKVRIIEEN